MKLTNTTWVRRMGDRNNPWHRHWGTARGRPRGRCGVTITGEPEQRTAPKSTGPVGDGRVCQGCLDDPQDFVTVAELDRRAGDE